MANDGTLDSELFLLIDNWTGPIISDQPPVGGFLSPLEHNVAEPVHLLGSKIQIRNRTAIAGDDGFTTFIYLKGLGKTGANPTVAAKQFVTVTTTSAPYQVSNDKDQVMQATGCPLAAVCLSVMTFTQTVIRFGWFWCGGVCPEQYVRTLGGNFPTKDGAVITGPVACDSLSTDAFGLAAGGADTSANIGYSYSDDS